jgi:hypothetical protein
MPKFRLGLTMAGAISAGAYSGGVFDMIFEALAAWEREKARLRDAGIPEADWPVPSHDVIVPVISGASAGSITGAVGLLALADPPTAPVDHPYPQVCTVQTLLPRLYEAWVKRPCFVHTDACHLLGIDDLGAGRKLASVLDTTLLDQIAEDAVRNVGSTAPRASLADPVHLFVTATNMQGIPYEIGFSAGAGTNSYIMTSHADRVHYAVGGVGLAALDSPWADPDPAIAIDVADPARAQTPLPPPWRGFADATLASGAFPIGLSARPLPQADLADIVARQWPIARVVPDTPFRRLLPAHPAMANPELLNQPHAALVAQLAGEAKLARVAVDGGMIDNEPFELARWTLMEKPGEPNPRPAKEADRAVIMIDPFPSAPAAGVVPDGTLPGVVRRLLPLLLNQARFKLDAAVAALDETVKSRFLIAPVRKLKPGGEPEPHAIACGLLGGFGGFLSEEMRAHDYQLGQLNGYLFLRDHFGFPEDNVVIKPGYGAGARRAAFECSAQVGVPGRLFQMIPLMDSVAVPTPPRWPLASMAEVDDVVVAAGRRADALVGRLAPDLPVGGLVRWGLRQYWRFSARRRLLAELRRILLAALRERGQIMG